VDELHQALETRRVAMLQRCNTIAIKAAFRFIHIHSLVIRADDVTTQMAAAIFKQEEQVTWLMLRVNHVVFML